MLGASRWAASFEGLPPCSSWQERGSRLGVFEYPCPVTALSNAELAALAEEATVDCYGEDEQASGFYTMIGDNLEVPFGTRVLGVDVTVEDVDLTDEGSIVAICVRGGMRQAVRVVDLPLPTPSPAGAEWIEAYRHWLG
jgi:hypothetical protein